MNLRGRNKVSAEFNMSSMTDIVFLLLIFFMLTSTMVTTNALDLVLPKAKGKTDNNKSISVSITKNLTYYIDKTPVAESEIETQVLSLLKGETSKSIVLRAEEGVPIEKAVAILDIANRNQIKVVLAVNPK
ncbi:Biopolymer transport protein ExbD/TolR; potentially related to transport or biosynthesis of folate [Flavobacterium sp. 9R]|jgi:biopolymer transport protein ExbD|uniref:ExbD/TolR family protein n=1 Tax=Flavobacterium sp. 9R TaxID=2653143 RepID=UPI0012EFF04E|nr:biopolymer transporter ExbD [Flavobacterium sp. 9R]VXB01661.1 Biopolymer transport protein ExbD/TolR; potentially related to transport or biosynthesis of folate [Flavobacterium sp. 9R]